MPALVPRRRFLAGAGALAAAPTARRLGVPNRGQPAAAPFSWGVASFDPTETGVLLWTRVAPGAEPVELEWVLSADDALRDVQASGAIEVGPATDHCAVVEVDDLAPGGIWWYGFTTPDGARSPVGRTRTMPDEADRIRLGVVSCSRYASAGYAAYRALSAREVDAVVHLGDYIYEDGRSGARPHDPPARLLSVDQYRRRYAQHRADPDLQALHARHPFVAVWDDHEIAGNAWRDGAAGHDPAADGPWIDRLVAAGQAHEEWLPGRTDRHPDDGRLKAWRRSSFGDLAELVVLDTRAWGRDRQPAAADEVGGPPEGGAAGTTRSLLGEDQEAFVEDLLGRPARPPWTIVANQVMLHPLRVPVPGEGFVAAVEAAGFLVVDGSGVNPDQWDGYPQARDRLVAAAGDRGGVVVVTGDVHSSWAWEVPAADGRPPAMVELVAPSVSTEALATRLPVPAGAVESILQGLSPDLAHVELSSHGYLVVDLDRDRVQGEWWYVDPADPATQRFGAACQAPREPPMRLSPVAEPTADPPPTTTSTTADLPSSPAGRDDRGADDDSAPFLAIGASAGAVAAVAAALVAVRSRRTR
ncbi:MAG: alkaline phosphatase D family protein [Acidimicrobiales bacterium]